MHFHHLDLSLSEPFTDHSINSCTLQSSQVEDSQSSLPRVGERESTAVLPHPLGIKPAGNAYASTQNIKAAAGSLATLPDELLVQVLELLDATTLQRLGRTCKTLYAFSRLEDLWKALCIE